MTTTVQPRVGRGSAWPTAALLGVTAAWGSTFFLIKDLLDRLPVSDFLAVRFTIAAAALWIIAPRSIARLSPQARRQGALLGLLYGTAQLLQTAGLAHTSASVSGFITGMYVVFTPIFAALMLRQRIPRVAWFAVVMATAGLALLSLRGLSLGYGETITLISAALYALHIVGLGAWSKARDAYGLSVLQMLVISIVCWFGAVPGGVTLPATTIDWAAVLYMALISGALALVAQTWAQAHLMPTRAAIIMTMEPVFAATFAVLLGGELLGVRTLFGGALVLAAMYLVEIGPRHGRSMIR